MAETVADRYFVPIAARTLDVLEAFEGGEELTLEQLIRRTGIAHTTAFRLVHTLVQRGYLQPAGTGKRYRASRVRRRRKLGFAALTSEAPFAQAITESLGQAAAAAGFALSVYDNRRDAEAAVANARAMVAEGVDVAIEFQRYDQAAPVIADVFHSAGIPTISVLLDQPGAVYCGVDNFRAGRTAGTALAEFAEARQEGRPELILFLDVPQAGPTVQARFSGAWTALTERLGPMEESVLVRCDGRGLERDSYDATLSVLRKRAKARRILVYAINDESALGARAALRARGRAEAAAVLGNGGSEALWPLIAAGEAPYFGTIAFYPERYGPALVDLAQRILRREPVAPSHYVPHALVAPGARG